MKMTLTNPELGGGEVEAAHEVHDHGKDADLDENDREVGHDPGHAHCAGSIEGIVAVSRHDRTTADSLHQLAQLKPAEEEDREEQSAPSGEGTIGAEGLAVEQRAHYEADAHDATEGIPISGAFKNDKRPGPRVMSPRT